MAALVGKDMNPQAGTFPRPTLKTLPAWQGGAVTMVNGDRAPFSEAPAQRE